jgi:transposase
MDRKRIYTGEERERWIQWKKQKEEKDGKRCNLQEELKLLPSAPHRDTIRRWEVRQLKGESLETNTSNWGAPALMTHGEKEVLAGWVLLREKNNEVTTGQDVINFVLEAFGVEVDKSWVSHTMHSLGFSSQKTQDAHEKKPLYTKMSEIKSFIQSIRDLIEDGVELSRIVCADETPFWNSGAVLRSYAVKGG